MAAKNLLERGARARRDERRHLPDVRIPLDGEELRDRDAADLGDPAEVVAHHVDDHHVLGALLGRLAQLVALTTVLRSASGRGAPCPSSAGVGRRDAVELEEQLRRSRADRPVANAEIKADTGPAGPRSGRRKSARARPRNARRHLEREIDLVGVAAARCVANRVESAVESPRGSSDGSSGPRSIIALAARSWPLDAHAAGLERARTTTSGKRLVRRARPAGRTPAPPRR